jgi:isopropylmalate/homocitrate/citramalate synthase
MSGANNKNEAGRGRKQKIILIDGTLREGEQSAGVFFTAREKIKLIRLMDKAGIDIADCGMPAVSKDEFNAIKKLAALKDISIRIGASVRCLPAEIELFSRTGASDCFIIVPVSDIHIKEKFRMTRGEYIEYVKKCVSYAAGLKIAGIHLALEDMSRTDEDFYLKLINAVRNLGLRSVKAVYMCDTVGVALPEKIRYQVETVLKELNRGSGAADGGRSACHIGVGIHCHNDYGLALANTLSAYDAGAEYITFTQNGIGERAGNAKYHELVMALVNLKKCGLKVDKSYISKLSKTVEEISGIMLSAIEPVVGFNAFRHESGIHVSGLLRDRKIYEQYRPEEIGRKNEYVLGKHTGTALVCKLLKELFPGDDFSREEMLEILKVVKARRMSVKKNDYAAMRRSLRAFYEKALGGVKISEFIKIVNSVKNERIL